MVVPAAHLVLLFGLPFCFLRFALCIRAFRACMMGAVSDWLWDFGLELWDLLLFASLGHGCERCGEGGGGLHPSSNVKM